MVQQSVLILGATSDMGRAMARAFAKRGCDILLAARHVADVQADITDLTLRGARRVAAVALDVLATEDFSAFINGLGLVPDLAVCVVGMLGEQKKAETDAAHAARIMRSNYNGPALLLAELANRMEARGSGVIVGVSSVAGDRGRASNYVYGSAKAGFTAFLSGLRARLSRTGVRIITVKPGFVATRMTAHLDLPEKLTAQPEQVAAAILAAIEKKRDVIYVLPVWRAVMTLIRLMPEFVFKRLRF